MSKKELKIGITSNPNSMVTIIGRDMGAISASQVEAVIDFATDEAKYILQNARAQQNYIPFLADETKIKSLVLMTNGKVYPSTFRTVTLMERVKGATDEFGKIQEEYSPA